MSLTQHFSFDLFDLENKNKDDKNKSFILNQSIKDASLIKKYKISL